MWLLLRGVALALLLAVGVLAVGRGDWLLAAVNTLLGPLGATPVPRAATEPSPLATIGGLALGSAAAFVHPVHRVVGQVVTLLHELGHTVMAASLGARPRGIVLRHDASGHATARWVGRSTPFRRVGLAAVAFVGLPAAAAVSAAGVELLTVAGPRAVLWSVAAAGGVVGLLARSAWSLLVAVATAGLAVVTLGDAAEPWTASVAVALLTAVAIKTTYDNLRRMRRPIRDGDDARVVGRHLRLPARFVQFVQVALGGALSGHALWLLLPAVFAAG
jgi:hypothetical protein